jgi:hypothetical protein
MDGRASLKLKKEVKMKVEFFVKIKGNLVPVNLDEILSAAAESGALNGDTYSGFTHYEFTEEGILFDHLPDWKNKLLIKWNGEKVTLPFSSKEK